MTINVNFMLEKDVCIEIHNDEFGLNSTIRIKRFDIIHVFISY